ncbi:hypothetical protein RUM44_005689 [Polyplax serrata]|uniref:Mitochondrial 3-ketoacyl-coa thiolase n=1 Tax=Polyplax serrata TaxID=468196 RepID=A0ABR1AWA6_POLSC
MSSLAKGVFIVAAKRTPFGTFGGKFTNKSACDLLVTAMKAALASSEVAPTMVDSVIVGNVTPSSSRDGTFMARHAQLKSGIPLEKNAYSVNRLCGSGFQSIVNGVQEIMAGQSQIVVCGGAENMTQYPFVVRNVRFGTVLGSSQEFEDSLWLGLIDSYCSLPMALTAEKLAKEYKIGRDETDDFALRSQELWKKAQDNGYFKEELAPVTITVKKKEIVVDMDEHPRPETTIDKLKKLPPLFAKDGVVTAGTASGICDGAGALILASEEAVKANCYKPLARLVSYSVAGVEPSIMGIGPAPAIKKLLERTGLKLNDIDMIEINEAFGAQTLACAKDLQLDINKLNVNGGAIALGHPLAASGSRITTHLVYELRRRNAKYGIGSACIGGGQGIALLIESLK